MPSFFNPYLVLRRDLINEWLEAPGTNAPGSATYPETYAAGPYDMLWNRIDKMNLDSGGNFKGQMSYSIAPTSSRKLKHCPIIFKNSSVNQMRTHFWMKYQLKFF